jgi:hypothetical protein
MPAVLRHFPILEIPQRLVFQGRELVVKRNQLAVWMSLSPDNKTPGTRLFPALIDTGFGYTFALHADHLHNWSQLFPDYEARSVRVNGIAYSRAPRVFLWLYRQWSNSAQGIAAERPILLDTGRIGIAVNTQRVTSAEASAGSAAGRVFPRIPIIGMKTLRQNRLSLFVDAWRSRFSLYQGRIWPWQW